VSGAERRAPAGPADLGPAHTGPVTAPVRERWLLSYADFLTLLLALFVVLYASARVDAEKNRGLFEGLQSAFLPGPPESEAAVPDREGGLLAGDGGGPNHRAESADPAERIERLASTLAERVERERERRQRDPGVAVRASERGLVISLAAAEYFPAGGAEIAEERKPMLAAIGPLLASQTGTIAFEGHADDRPSASASFPTNWELSSARAAAVARYFIANHGLDPARVATTGYAAYRPVATGDSPADRARNRRVEIVVLADGAPAGPETPEDVDQALSRLLDALPPLAGEPDESLRGTPRERP
jgi:chemotaxis protein MotB